MSQSSPALQPQPPPTARVISRPQVGDFNPNPPSQPTDLKEGETRLNGISIQVVKDDIVSVVVRERVQTVVNAVNSHSFTTGDGGISGALRDTMYMEDVYQRCLALLKPEFPPDIKKEIENEIQDKKRNSGLTVCNATKYFTVDKTKSSDTIDETKAAWQETTGYLKQKGVRYVIHSVGPNWTDEKYVNKTTDCVSNLRTTIENTLNLAKSLNVESVAFPLISGGLFCHSQPILKGRDQAKAQELLIRGIMKHLEMMDTTCRLKKIFIVEINTELYKSMKNKLDTYQRPQTGKFLPNGTMRAKLEML